MNVIFLDIDGVMVTDRTLRAYSKDLGNPFDPYCVTQFNMLLDKTKAKIVISSTWRMGKTLKKLKNILRLNGVMFADVIDKTPVLHVHRGLEIQMWLDVNKHLNIEKFIIIDDDSDMEHLMPRLVKCSMYGGFRHKHRKQAIKMLS